MGEITTSTVFLVSGGARGITAQCVIEMAQHFHCKFILLGRTALEDEPAWANGLESDADLKKAAIGDMQARGEKPTPALIGRMVRGVTSRREIHHTLEAVQQAGGEAVYLSADITDTTALQAALQTVSHMGQVTGIIHGAGNLADKLIENKTEADFENVYAAKVEGLENMLAVVPGAQLQSLVLFSSVAGFYGNVGQADYAMANEILNKTAYRFKKLYPDCHVVSINWGPWDGGMVTDQLRAYFDELGIKIIPIDVGTRMLVEELRNHAGQMPVQVVVGSAIQPQPAPPQQTLQTYRLHRTLRLQDSPFLGDHVVNSQAVLPMVSAMSWMASACEQIHPGYHYYSFENYRVLKGIVFDKTLANEHVLELKEISKSAEEIVIEAMVRSQSPEGKPRFHYSTRILLRPKFPEVPVYTPPFTLVDSEDIPGTRLYEDGTLFHRYSFQGVETVLSISEQGLQMRCSLPAIDLAYQGQFPIQAFNYFMVDVGLQSIGIWARRFYDAGSLPLRAGKGEHFMRLNFGATYYVTMEVVNHSETNVTANITLHDENNRVYMAIYDLQVTMSKRLNAMFLKNTLPGTV